MTLPALMLLAACSLHQPVQVSLPVDLPETYLEQGEPGLPEVVQGAWWSSFEDPQLDLLMTELFAQSLQLEQGFARLQQAQASARIIRSARFPSLDANADTGRSMQPTSSGDYTGNNTQLAAAARFELDLWGKLAARDKAASKSAEARYEELQTLYISLSAQLADLYYLAVEQRSQLALTDETIRSFRDTVDLVEGRYRLGLVPALDVYQARQNLAAAKATRPLFEANLAAAEHAVAVLVGRYPDRESSGTLAILPSVPETYPAGLPSELVAHRPDLRAALRRVEAADANVAAAIADRYPSINLLGSYGHSRQDFSTGLIEGDFWSLLGSLTLPVIDAGRRRAEVERNQAVVRESVAAYQQALLNAFRDVEDALSSSQASEARIIGLIDTEQATGSSLRLSLDRYLFGVNDYLPVLTAQRNHFEARSRLLTARRELISSRISLLRALGGTWMHDEIEERFISEQDHSS
jgi:NodT family efflux transporter outer membrane factor (OMF) lipoprotein